MQSAGTWLQIPVAFVKKNDYNVFYRTMFPEETRVLSFYSPLCFFKEEMPMIELNNMPKLGFGLMKEAAEKLDK